MEGWGGCTYQYVLLIQLSHEEKVFFTPSIVEDIVFFFFFSRRVKRARRSEWVGE